MYSLINSEQGNSDRGRQVSREVLQLAGGSAYGFASVGGLLGIIALCVFAASISASVGFGLAMAGVAARVRLAMMARLIKVLLRRIVEE